MMKQIIVPENIVLYHFQYGCDNCQYVMSSKIGHFIPHFGTPLLHVRKYRHFQTLYFFSRRAGVPVNQE